MLTLTKSIFGVLKRKRNRIQFIGVFLMFKTKRGTMPRQKKFNEESVVLGFRVPKSKEVICREIIQKWINSRGWEKIEAKRRARNDK